MSNDRRPSLIDQMAMAAASQILLLDDDDDDDSSCEDDGDDVESLSDGDVEQATTATFRVEYLERLAGDEEVEDEDDDDDDHVSAMSPPHSEAGDEFGDDSPIRSPWEYAPGNSTDAIGNGNISDLWIMPDSRSSFSARRSSYQSDDSFHSAPTEPTQILTMPDSSNSSRRHSYSQRRTSVNLKSIRGASAAAAAAASTEEASSTTSSNNHTSFLSFVGRRPSTRRPPRAASPATTAVGLDQALDSLRSQDSNPNWENVAAAVTVVAAGSQPPTKHVKFTVHDTVLVFLTLLNVTNLEDPKDSFTVAPVNVHGYPAGAGRTEDEKVGPYNFVLATVKHVHFDEDDRYYTVVRADTGTEQRSDSGWMEPLRDPDGIEAALRAAKRTVRSTQDKPMEMLEETGCLQNAWDCLVDAVSWPKNFTQNSLLPWYRQQRFNAKQLATQLLYGDSPFACKLRVTGINFLVLCSFIFLFLEVINLAFFPASYDHVVAISGTVVWCLLVIELVVGVIIRPKTYFDLVESDKAFAPSTARHINRFHLIFEALALLTFLPEFQCLVNHDYGICRRESVFSRVRASADAVLGETHGDAARGRFLLGITALRFFGVVRHWKQMWINNTFRPIKREGLEKWLFPQEKNIGESQHHTSTRQTKKFDMDVYDSFRAEREESLRFASEEDQRLKNAATIGTALMVVNSQRALILLTAIVLVLPLLGAIGEQNRVSSKLVTLLQANNIVAGNDCAYLEAAINSWLQLAVVPQPASFLSDLEDTYVLWGQVLPVRCDFQSEYGVITMCDSENNGLVVSAPETCRVWDEFASMNVTDFNNHFFANELGVRVDAISSVVSGANSSFPDYQVAVVYNENPTISLVNMGMFFLLSGILLVGLYGLQALRGFAFRLVLDPLQRMLKIVLRYAENPLSQDVRGTATSLKKLDEDSLHDNEGEEIGNFETEQLINAITKIADLLRKCWGVAGAGIISSNLARTKDGKTVVFNPTVPGKRVYALFGFVAINGFSEQLRALDRDVMILINDVAKVVHDEVYRWALGDHGQCNKNLGSSFLMVFRIGDFSEVQKKKRVATEKLFRETNAQKNTKKVANLRRRTRSSTTAKSYATRRVGRHHDGEGQLQLASLPGIQTFTDRALLGMLKSFAGLHRDKNLNVWKNDFRLSAGVSAYHVDVIYGMDAGWAVEGAVGSEYKIDATYLSPHVNMASRMMSATKQYGVTILLSKAVEELLSRNCRKKLRKLDTVYVKGSKVKQDIFTYDARHKGVDFFLIERTPEQADMDAECYNQHIWDTDQDLRAMRQHVSDEFMELYHLAVDQYLAGNWKEAHKNFELANDKMIETVLADGYMEYDLEELEGRIFNKEDQNEDIVRIRNELGDGACHVLMAYMERRNLTAPNNWGAVRQLYSK